VSVFVSQPSSAVVPAGVTQLEKPARQVEVQTPAEQSGVCTELLARHGRLQAPQCSTFADVLVSQPSSA